MVVDCGGGYNAGGVVHKRHSCVMRTMSTTA